MSETAEFKYTVKKKNGFKSTTTGTLRSPKHHGVVTAALNGELSEDCDLLRSASKIIELVKPIRDILGFAEWASPEHAEEILKSLIDKYHGPLSDALSTPTSHP